MYYTHTHTPRKLPAFPKKIWSFMAWLRWIHFPFQKTNRVPKLLQTAHGSGRMSGWMVMESPKNSGEIRCKICRWIKL